MQLKEHALDLMFLLGFLTPPVNIGGSCPALIPLPIFVFLSCADSFCRDFSAPRSQARAASRFSHAKSAQARAWVQRPRRDSGASSVRASVGFGSRSHQILGAAKVLAQGHVLVCVSTRGRLLRFSAASLSRASQHRTRPPHQTWSALRVHFFRADFRSPSLPVLSPGQLVFSTREQTLSSILCCSFWPPSVRSRSSWRFCYLLCCYG
jgi:hypothetical protein